MDEVFLMIEGASEKFEFTLRVSMLEIYNERIQDLLNSRGEFISTEEQPASERR